MAPQHPISPQGRDRAFRRLHRLTLGAAIGSLTAIVGLGTLAAWTNPGHTASANASSGQSSGSSTAGSSAGTSSDSGATLQPASQAPSSAEQGTASVSSGGS
jgi:hypothetical protein